MHTLLFAVFLFLSALTHAQEMDVLHYRFRISLTDENDTVRGRAEIRFVVLQTAASFQFDLGGLNGEGSGMLVESVSTLNRPEGRLPFKQQNGKLLLFTTAYKKGDTARVRILYKGIPEDGLIISKNKYGDRTFFADNWPNRAHYWIPCNDRPDDKATVEFTVIAPAHYQVISNGRKVNERKRPQGFTETHWQEDVALPTKVMVIGAARFAVKTYSNSPEGVPVSAWVYPQDSTRGFYDYAQATEIIRFFSDYIGPYPFNKLANVQSTTVFGGMENASCIFYAETSVTGNRQHEDLLAHEIAHQWFGDMVSEKSFAHLWLSEGFATYLTDLYIEKKYGRQAALQRWQKEREQAVAFARRAVSAVVDSTNDLPSLLNANSYQKGGWVLHMLRNEVGDTVFHQILKTFYNQYKGGNAETSDFEAVAEAVSGKNLQPFFRQWLQRPGVPVLRVKTYVQKNTLVVTIIQNTGKPFHFPLEILIESEDGQQKLLKEWVDASTKIFREAVSFKVARITLDPECRLLFAGEQKIKAAE